MHTNELWNEICGIRDHVKYFSAYYTSLSKDYMFRTSIISGVRIWRALQRKNLTCVFILVKNKYMLRYISTCGPKQDIFKFHVFSQFKQKSANKKNSKTMDFAQSVHRLQQTDFMIQNKPKMYTDFIQWQQLQSIKKKKLVTFYESAVVLQRIMPHKLPFPVAAV